MRGIPTHFSPTGVVTTLLGMTLLALLARTFWMTNTERVAAFQPVALVLAPPPPAPTPAPKPDEPKPEPVQQLDPKTLEMPGPAGPPGAPGGPVSASGPLGLAETGESGADAFGLAGRPGGTELLLTGGGGGNPNARFVQFAQQLRSYVEKELSSQHDVGESCYTVDVLMRLSGTGSVQDVTIVKSTGVDALDRKIRKALQSLAPLDGVPPPDMPWPVGLRLISSRNDCEASSSVSVPANP